MAHSNIRAKVRRRKVASLAAYSRRFSVKNNTIPKSELNEKNIVHVWKDTLFLPKYEVDNTGNSFWVDDEGHYHKMEPSAPFKHVKAPQPKRLIKCKKRRYSDWKSYSNQHGEKELKREKRNYFVTFFKNYPYTLPKMNHTEYMEKLVEHKLKKWERKNPKPMDMFTEDVEKWNQLRESAKERLRDFVVSIYDKLPLIGRFKTPTVTATYTEKKIADIKDINGDGHRVNEMPKDAPLLKKVQKITNKTKRKCPNLVATNLKDHKRQKGRIILPQAA